MQEQTTPEPRPTFRRFLLFAATCPLALIALGAFAQAPSGGAGALGQASSSSPLSAADEVFEEMSRITGLPIRTPLKKRIITRPEVRHYLIENLHAEYTPKEFHVQEATLEAFGLVSRDFDLEKFLITFYTEQAAGFYDPRRKTMFIADWPSEDEQKMVLAHELTHALQDQSFDLEKFLRAAREDDDATAARQAIVEGHAMAAMMQHLIGPDDLASLPALEPLMAGLVHQQLEEYPVYSKAPYFFRLQTLFPYSAGMGFMQRGLAQGGWKRLNLIFSNPPATTREIYDPQLYFNPKPLPKISLPRPPVLSDVSGLRLLAEKAMGELGYCALLGQFISEDEAKRVGREWLADRYILYESTAPRGFALVARTRWSSDETALAFFRDYHSILAKKFPELVPEKPSGPELFAGSTSSGEVLLLRKGDEVVWAEGVPAAQADAILDWLRSL